MTTAPPLLAAQGLGRRRLGSDEWLFRDVTLDIHGGDCLAIMGPTGAGKTLLLRALSLLDPVDAGHVHWQGRAVAAGEVPRYRRQAVYLHQRPTLVEGTVEQNLRLPYSLHAGRQRQFDRTKALKFLNVLGRGAEFLSQTDDNLSGGERQLVAV